MMERADGGDRGDLRAPTMPGPPARRAVDDQPQIESDGRLAGPAQGAPPDPRTVIDDLRRRLRAEQEKSLNSIDAVLGAQAAAAQAKAETQEVFYRLHVRETELEQLKELLADENRALSSFDGGPAAAPGGSADEEPTPAVAARMLLSSIKRAVTDR